MRYSLDPSQFSERPKPSHLFRFCNLAFEPSAKVLPCSANGRRKWTNVAFSRTHIRTCTRTYTQPHSRACALKKSHQIAHTTILGRTDTYALNNAHVQHVQSSLLLSVVSAEPLFILCSIDGSGHGTSEPGTGEIRIQARAGYGPSTEGMTQTVPREAGMLNAFQLAWTRSSFFEHDATEPVSSDIGVFVSVISISDHLHWTWYGAQRESLRDHGMF